MLGGAVTVIARVAVAEGSVAEAAVTVAVPPLPLLGAVYVTPVVD
jgi:hypothetical protein